MAYGPLGNEQLVFEPLGDGWNETDKCSTDREGQQWLNHSFFETLNVDQLINSLCRGDDDAATFRRIEVDPGESLAVLMLIFLVHPCLFLSGPLSLCLRSFFL